MSRKQKAIVIAWIGLVFASCAFAQNPIQRSAGNAPVVGGEGVGSLIVYVRTQDGQSLPDNALPTIHVASTLGYSPLPNPPSRSGDGWMISGLAVGEEYQVIVSAIGFLPGTETVQMPNIADASASVIVFLKPVDQQLVFHPPMGDFVLAPKPAKEIQRALQDLQRDQIKSAQKHTGKAMSLAPGNPYVQYVMGMTFLVSRQFAEAKPYLEKSVSIDPKVYASLNALGTVRYQLGDAAGAIQVLGKAVHLDTKAWKSEWILAAAYLQQKNYVEARDHARRALKLDPQNTGPVELLLGEALAGTGDWQGAKNAFEKFAARYPSDPNAHRVLEWVKLQEHPKPAAITHVASHSLPTETRSLPAISAVPAPPAETPPNPNWAPADVDSAKFFVVSTRVCPLPKVLRRAGKNAEELVRSLQEFSATEDFQEVELKRGEQLERPSETQFEYLVSISQPSAQIVNVDEIREKDSLRTRLPARVQDSAAALALAVHPVIQKDLEWKCEGLGTWDDQPAWVVHFEQKPNAPDVLASFSTPTQSYAMPLKGRAWISEWSYQVLHLDVDLKHPITSIDLKREHFSIDYKPVLFHQHNVQLWLPQTVDTYIQFQGHFLHYYHRFSDFKLFWVGTSQKIGAPKEAEKVNKQPDKQQQQQ